MFSSIVRIYIYIYVYTRCTAKCISWLIQPSLDSFFSLTIPLHFPFQLPTQLRWFCFAYVLAPPPLCCVCILSLSLSLCLSLDDLHFQAGDLSRLYEPTPIVRSGTPAPSNRGQRWNTSEHTYEYDCSARLYRLSAIVNF